MAEDLSARNRRTTHRDRRQQILDFGPSVTPEARSTIEPTHATNTVSSLLTVPNSDLYQDLRHIVSAKQKFERSDDSPFPIAYFKDSETQGSVQLKPDSAAEQALLPADEDSIAQLLWERVKKLSDLEADVLDILTSNWLKQAKTIDDRATIYVDELMSLRGIKPKQSGQKRRGGYGPEQRLTHLKAATVIFDLWLTIAEAVVYIGKGKRQRTRSLQSRPFVITDRLGDLRLYDDHIDVRQFTYVPGEAFAIFLMSPQGRQLAFLSARALEYNVRTQSWHKRLTRYYSYLWRRRVQDCDYEKPLKISTICRDGLQIDVNSRWLAHTMERFSECHRTLQRDKVIAPWRYERQDGPWTEWTIIIEPPDVICHKYQEDLPVSVSFYPPPRHKSSSRIRAKCESLGLSQRRLAKELGISQSTISRAESEGFCIPEPLRRWQEDS
jgi:hypothetical protein